MPSADLTVMQSFRAPRGTTNPYIHMLDEALATTAGIDHRRFSWKTAFFGRLDVFHVHWPEVFLEGRTPVHRFVRRVRFQALLASLRLRRVALVRTVHNLELPSGISGWDRRMLESIRRGAAVSIALNAQTEVPGEVAVIPHGHYVDWFAGMPTSERVPARAAFVGLIRRYKGVETLLDAYADLRSRDDRVSLSVSGRPSTPELADEIRERARVVPDIHVRLEYLTEPDYVLAVTGSSAVVLPYLHMHNSGSVLAALSLARPVLVPDTEVNRALSDEVGAGWIHLFTGTLDAKALSAALSADLPAAPPDLSARGWQDAGRAHADAYRRAARRRA